MAIRNLFTRYMKYWKNYNWYIKYQISYLYEPYVWVAFLFFVNLQTALLPVYLILYLYMVLSYGLKIYWYLSCELKKEVCPIKNFHRFENVWLTFIYNVTYKRACINSFAIIYFILKLCKSNNSAEYTWVKKLTNYIKIILKITVKLFWNFLTGVPWFIITRSFQYSKALSFTYEWSPFDPRLMEGYVINNYQLSELTPTIHYRIYKTELTPWNFNPAKIDPIKIRGFMDLFSQCGNYHNLFNSMNDSLFIQIISHPTSKGYHYSSFFRGLLIDEKPLCLGINLTGNLELYPYLLCFGTSARSISQNITGIEAWYYDTMNIKPSQELSGFQKDASYLKLLQVAFMISTLFNSDENDILSLEPLLDRLTSQGITITSHKLENILLEAKVYTLEIDQFITSSKLNMAELQELKYAVLFNKCPELVSFAKSVEFSGKPNRFSVLKNDYLLGLEDHDPFL